MVATIALIGSLSLGMLMLISPKVYAAVVNWVTEWYDTYVMYRFSSEHTESDLPEYQLSYIPEGYHHNAEILSTPNDYSRATSMRFMAYSGDHWLFFQYGPMDSGSAMSIELENMSVSEISIMVILDNSIHPPLKLKVVVLLGSILKATSAFL